MIALSLSKEERGREGGREGEGGGEEERERENWERGDYFSMNSGLVGG